MDLKSIHTDKAPEAIGPYSQAICAGSFVFISGQLGIDPQTGNLVSDDFTAQVRQVLDNLKAIVAASGCDISQVTAVDVFLTDMAQFANFNQIYKEYFNEKKPARAVVEVSALPKSALVEVKCVVYKG